MNRRAELAVRILLTAVLAVTAIDWVSSGHRMSSHVLPLPEIILDMNRAPAEDLELLPGIGPVIARRILEERSRRPFENIDDFVRRVKGLGAAFQSSYGTRIRFGYHSGHVSGRFFPETSQASDLKFSNPETAS